MPATKSGQAGEKFPATFSASSTFFASSVGFELGLLQARLPDDGPERSSPEFGVIRDGYGYRACGFALLHDDVAPAAAVGTACQRAGRRSNPCGCQREAIFVPSQLGTAK